MGFHVAHHEVAWMDLENYLSGGRGVDLGNNFVHFVFVSNRRWFAAGVTAIAGGTACTVDSAL